MRYPFTPPDGADWTIDVEPAPDGGILYVIVFDLGGTPARLTLKMDRPDARLLARKTLACSGDGMERTFAPASGGGDAVPR